MLLAVPRDTTYVPNVLGKSGSSSSSSVFSKPYVALAVGSIGVVKPEPEPEPEPTGEALSSLLSLAVVIVLEHLLAISG